MQEASVMTSLHELRAIEQQRIADERAARDRARDAEVAAARAAEQARIDAAAAAAKAERDERLRIEQARADAEREARMRVQAAEAAERARLAAQLEQDRLAQELELRRAEVAKKRPTWMLAVTGVALAAGLGLAWFAVDRMHEADAAEHAKDRANEQMRQAKADAAAAVAKLDAMQRDLGELEGKVAQAQHALDAAKTEAQRKQAQALLDEANRKAAAARKRLEDEQRARARQDRLNGFDSSKCGNGVLGCIDKH